MQPQTYELPLLVSSWVPDKVLKSWSTFSVKNSANTTLNLRIVDMPKDRYEDVIELYMNYYITEETTLKASGVPKCAEAMAEVRESLYQRENDESFHTVICCLDKGDDKIHDIIGVSIMALATKEEYLKVKLQPRKAEALNTFRKVYGGMNALYDEMKEHSLDRYFIDKGIMVHPDYRGLGIAQEFLKVRRMMCKEHGIPIHGAWMTSYGTQKAAERDGWETMYEINYDDFGKEHGVTFENGPPSCKFMITKTM